jgi:membrane-associated phospholipid phosphatase
VLEASSTLVVRSPADRLARAISVVGAPPLMMLPLVALAGWYSEAGGRPLMNGALTMVASTAMLPCLFVYIAYRAGFVTSPDLPRRSERLQPAVFAALCAVAAYPLLRYVEAPLVFLRLDGALALQMIFLATVTIWWKISYHAGTAAGLALVAFAWGGMATALPFAMLALTIGWARVRLGRHTIAQVFAGWASALPACWWVWPA